MPGFINCHEHPLMYGDDYQNAHLQASSAYKALMGLAALQRQLLAGWTTVRVMGDADVHYANQDIRKTVDSGVFIAPRLTGAGHYISITGGGGDVNYFSPEQNVIADGLVADGPEEIRKAIRQEIKYGSDWIKLLVTGATSPSATIRATLRSVRRSCEPRSRKRAATACRSPRMRTPRTASSRPSPQACGPSNTALSSTTKASR